MAPLSHFGAEAAAYSETMKARIAFAAAFVGVAIVAAGYGIWLIATEDLQGGRDPAGAVILAAAGILGAVGVTVAPRLGT